MQSHVDVSNVNTSANAEDETNFHEDDGEDIEDYIDEDLEGENGSPVGTKLSIGSATNSRTVTLQMLLAADILQPGKGTMTIEYLGQKFTGDLLEDGKIRSQETDVVFASPSAWAIACKRFINPDKKSGCGWASVKYCGKKLDVYKNIWYRKRNEKRNQEIDNSTEFGNLMWKALQSNMQYHKIVVKHNTIANRTLTHDANTMIECVPFSNLGKIQPFLISLSTNAALLMDFHCHLTKSEVSGYLAGHWDVNTHNLQITHAFPCRCTKSDRENSSQIEAEIAKSIEKEKLHLIGWYHSHPFAAAAPTLRDVDAQLDYQIKMKGTSDNSYIPCVGIINSPYNYDNNSLESSIIAYWVIPPPETKPNEYGRPMLMSYSIIQDSVLTTNVKEEIKKCVDYYKKESDFINFSERYVHNNLYIDKLKTTLLPKFPRDESETIVWRFIKDALGYHSEENDYLLSIPSISKSSLLSNFNTSIASNRMLPTDLSNILFNAGKLPSVSSVLGLSDPLAHSTLAANNMFLSSNIFKIQDLLNPIPSTATKSDQKHASLKIPTDIKSKTDFPTDLVNYKNKTEFLAPDFNFSKDATISPSSGKQDFNVIDYSANIKSSDEQSNGNSTLNSLDLTTPKCSNESKEVATDLSVSSEQRIQETDNAPLNLAVE